MTDLYYDKEGKQISFGELAILIGKSEYKIIKQDELPNGKFVSTVWLGMDHQYGEGDPLIFETMVFPKKGDWGELDCNRYSTLEEAISGHNEMVNKYDK